jgi:hypothetical protein
MRQAIYRWLLFEILRSATFWGRKHWPLCRSNRQENLLAVDVSYVLDSDGIEAWHEIGTSIGLEGSRKNARNCSRAEAGKAQ